MVRRQLGVPVGLVSLVDDRRQFFPGQDGLGEPWAQVRQTPLSHSFCTLVVDSGEPLVVSDARTDPRVAGNPAVASLGVVAYLGVPLTDGEGQVLGSLCAIGTEARDWDAADVEALVDLAAACSSELRLRIAAERGSAALNRVAVLAQVTQAVTSTLDAQQTIDRLSRLVVPFLADWCTVHVADEAGRVHQAAAQHRRRRARRRDLQQFAAAQAVVLDPRAPTREVLRTEEALLLDDDPEGAAAALARGLHGADVPAPVRPARLRVRARGAAAVPGRRRRRARRSGAARTGRRSARPRCTTRSTSGVAPGSRCTTRRCTAASSTTPSRCSAACSRACRSPTTCTSSRATCRRPRRRRSAATGTTRSCSRTAPRCSSSATSPVTTSRPRR